MRLLYFSGPGDIETTYNLWKEGKDDPHQQAITYSGQFYSAAKELDAEVLAFSKSRTARTRTFRDGNVTIINKPALWDGAGGIRFYLGYLLRGLYIVYASVRYRADCVFVADGNTFWFILSILPFLGKKVVPLMHCVLWPRTKQPSRVHKLLLAMAKPFFSRHAFACMVVSNDITKQVMQIRGSRQVSGGRSTPMIEFIPSYRDIYSGIRPNRRDSSPFYVLFASRIEESKGVFILLELARRAKAEGLNMVFDVAGDGADLANFKAAVESEHLGGLINCHGYCYREQMRELVNRSHVFLVTTTDMFVEGFNKVCAESALANRPLVASSVCPALSYVSDICIPVEPNDIDGYYDAIHKLYFDASEYERMSHAAQGLHELFLSHRYSYQSAILEIGRAIANNKKPQERYVAEHSGGQ